MFTSNTSLTPSRFTPGTGMMLSEVSEFAKSANVDRVTKPFPRQYQWAAPNDYQNAQPDKAALFVIGRWNQGERWDNPKLMTIDQINDTARKAWSRYNMDLNVAKPPQLANFNKIYQANSEDQYYQDDTWRTCTAFTTQNELSRFIWMSHLSIDMMVRFMGPILGQPQQFATRERPLTTVMSGYAEIINYWGTVFPSERLYFIVKQTQDGKGPFQLLPWHGFSMPMSADLEYKDSLGNIRYGNSIFVGIVHRAPRQAPSQAEIMELTGQSGKSFLQVKKTVERAATLDIIASVGDIRA